MKTFDYETAWLELALPEYKKLPNAVLCLVGEVGIVADNLSQDSHCNMVWPDDGGKLREMFDRIDSTTLAHAARVVHYYGHWRPSGSISAGAPVINGGGHWKFSNYADQVLRLRFNIGRDVKHGVGLLIHEGAFRVCYSSNDQWTWHEVAMADESGQQAASKIADSIRRKISIASCGRDHENAAYEAFEEIKSASVLGWDTSPYMVEEVELEMRRAKRMPKPDKEKLIAKVKAEFEKEVAIATMERDSNLWLINHDIPTENAIFYSHTSQWCFGWRKPYAGDARLALLEALKEFPFSYDVK